MPEIVQIPVTKIYANPSNPRKTYSKESIAELAATIVEHGLRQPAEVREHPDGDDTYQINFGWRRYLAHKHAGLKTMDCVIRNISDEEVAEVMLVENLQREEVDIFEEAAAVSDAMKSGMEISAISAKIGKSPAWVAGRVKFAEMPECIIAMFRDGRLSKRHIMELAKVLSYKDRERLAIESVEGGYSVSDLRKEIESIQMKLSTAPWDLKKCRECRNRSGLQADLFGGEREELCLDNECWTRMMEQRREELINEANGNGHDVVSDKNASQAIYGYGPYTTSEERIKELKELGVKPHVLIFPDCTTKQAWPSSVEKTEAEKNIDQALRDQKNLEANEKRIVERQSEILVEMVNDSRTKPYMKVSDETFFRILIDAVFKLTRYSRLGAIIAEEADTEDGKNIVDFRNSTSVKTEDVRRALSAWAISVIGPEDIEPKIWKEMGIDYRKARRMAESK